MNSEKIGGMRKIKFPILRSVEYFDVIKNRETIKSYKGKELEGKTWRELQLLIGRDCGSGNYHYSFKQTSIADLNNGVIRAVGDNPKIEMQNIEPLKAEIKRLEQKLENASQGNGISFDLLISVTKQSYETQITFL